MPGYNGVSISFGQEKDSKCQGKVGVLSEWFDCNLKLWNGIL